jgi:catechol 2,3-dioxygenase-like lactoylglutathione lyase family enzyme
MIASLDHFVLTVRDLKATCAFYAALGMSARTFGEGRTALHFGKQKINLHQAGKEFEPKAARATPGSADVCFLVDVPLDEAAAVKRRHGIAIIEGPVDKTGAQGPIRSLYCRDPDGNLVELSRPIT